MREGVAIIRRKRVRERMCLESWQSWLRSAPLFSLLSTLKTPSLPATAARKGEADLSCSATLEHRAPISQASSLF